MLKNQNCGEVVKTREGKVLEVGRFYDLIETYNNRGERELMNICKPHSHNGIKVGDIVTVTYRTTPNYGLWFVAPKGGNDEIQGS